MFTSLNNQPATGLSDYFVLDISELLEWFRHEWESILVTRFAQAKRYNSNGYVSTDHLNRHGFMWESMDVSKIFSEAFECLKQETDVETEIPLFAFRDVQANVLYNFSQVKGQISQSDAIAIATELSAAAERLGFALYAYLKEQGFYHNGYFPYHFCGWFGGSVLVELDHTHGGFKETPDSLRLPYRGR